MKKEKVEISYKTIINNKTLSEFVPKKKDEEEE